MKANLSQRARAFLQNGLDLIYPPHCAGCQRSGYLLCPDCLQTMHPLTLPFCQHCGTPFATSTGVCIACQRHRLRIQGLRCLNLYQGPLCNAIHALKYHGQQRLARPLGLLLAEAFTCYNMRADGIVPLPLHLQRQQQRGYNQATLLARVCATHLKVPCLEQLVIRQRATYAQVGLNAQERWQNVSGAFALAPEIRGHTPNYHTLLLIDDVSTTGATLEACAAALYAAGINEVWGLVLGKPSVLVQDGSKGML